MVRQAVMNAKANVSDFNGSLDGVHRRTLWTLLAAREANPRNDKASVLALLNGDIIVNVADSNMTQTLPY